MCLFSEPLASESAFGIPVFGIPGFGIPGFGISVLRRVPVRIFPTFGTPAFGIPVFGIPTVGVPAFGIPTFGLLVEFRHRLIRCPLESDPPNQNSHRPTSKYLGFFCDIRNCYRLQISLIWRLATLPNVPTRVPVCLLKFPSLQSERPTTNSSGIWGVSKFDRCRLQNLLNFVGCTRRGSYSAKGRVSAF